MIISDVNPEGLMPQATYNKLTYEKQVNVIRRGCRATTALIEYASLPDRYRKAWERLHGDPTRGVVEDTFIKKLRADPAAVKFFSDYQLSDSNHIPLPRQVQYTNEAVVIRAMKEEMRECQAAIRASGGKRTVSWDKVVVMIHTDEVHRLYPHQLPTNTQSLRRKVKKYEAEGYEGLIHSAFCNDHSRKVSAMIERLILSLYTMPNKPFGADVYAMYNLFVSGKIEVFDKTSGELFDRSIFSHGDKPIELSEKTIWGVVNDNYNRAVVDSIRNDDTYNKKIHRPHHMRNPPKGALSKISMDDRDLPRKHHGGDWVKAYYSYDVLSGCVIGYSFSRTKDDALFLECLRNMFQTIKCNALPIPGEVEVEHHIVNHFKDELDMMFPIVRWCGAGNSQEKHAEHMNRAKKYGVEKKRHTGIGRWWAKSEAYLTKSKRDGADYVNRTYDYDMLVAEDISDINEYNNSLHPKQKKYPGMTRWEVLLHEVNTELAQPNDALIYYCIGNKTTSTIRNNQYLKVQYAEYQLPTPQHITKLKPNNYSVDAYWLPNSEGEIREVYIYQDGKYIGKCDKIDHYNTARIEWTEQDRAGYEKQAAYVSAYDKRIVKDGKRDKINRLGIIEAANMVKLEDIPTKIIEVTPFVEESFESLLYPSTAKHDAITNL